MYNLSQYGLTKLAADNGDKPLSKLRKVLNKDNLIALFKSLPKEQRAALIGAGAVAPVAAVANGIRGYRNAKPGSKGSATALNALAGLAGGAVVGGAGGYLYGKLNPDKKPADPAWLAQVEKAEDRFARNDLPTKGMSDMEKVMAATMLPDVTPKKGVDLTIPKKVDVNMLTGRHTIKPSTLRAIPPEEAKLRDIKRKTKGIDIWNKINRIW